jgi:hypothetical protein
MCLDKTFDRARKKEFLITFVKLPDRKRGRRDIEAGEFVPGEIESHQMISTTMVTKVYIPTKEERIDGA